MSTFTIATTYTHTVTYVTTKMLLTLKEIIREIGLDPAYFADRWDSYERAISTWLTSRHLERITLEVYNPRTDVLVTRWDLDVMYTSVGDGAMWVDTAAIRYAIAKAGMVPASCRYRIVVTNANGRPDVAGWSGCELRSTAGFDRYSSGATLGGNGLSADMAFWSRT